MGRVANRKFADNADMLDAFFSQLIGNFADFIRVDGFNLPAPVIDGASDGKVMGVGAVKFRVDAGTARHDHTHRREFVLNNRIGGQRGAQNNPVNIRWINVLCYCVQTGQHGLKQIGRIGSDFNFFLESIPVKKNHIGVGAANI